VGPKPVQIEVSSREGKKHAKIKVSTGPRYLFFLWILRLGTPRLCRHFPIVNLTTKLPNVTTVTTSVVRYQTFSCGTRLILVNSLPAGPRWAMAARDAGLKGKVVKIKGPCPRGGIVNYSRSSPLHYGTTSTSLWMGYGVAPPCAAMVWYWHDIGIGMG